MEKYNDIRSITTNTGLVVWIDFPDWGPHPGLIIGEYDDGDLMVLSGTSQLWHEGDPDFIKVEHGCGLLKPTYFNCTETYRVSEDTVMSIAGEMPDVLFTEIIERVEGL